MCMRVLFHHRKNGFASLTALSMNPRAAVVTSSSTVSMRFLVSGPVSSIACPPANQLMDDPARAKPFLELRTFRVIRVLGFLFRIQVVGVAEELVKSVIGRQGLVPVAEMVLAELPGDVTEWLEQSGDG